MKKWFCTDCEDLFTDETGERCPQCGFRRVIGPVQYANRAECAEAIRNPDRHPWAGTGRAGNGSDM